jgi:PHP family Zn ribbon phosphoesterase
MEVQKPEHDCTAILTRLERLVERMQKIQRQIKAAGEPASRFEIETLEELGREYGVLIAQLRKPLS